MNSIGKIVSIFIFVSLLYNKRTCSDPKTSPFAMDLSNEYAIWPAAPVTQTFSGSD